MKSSPIEHNQVKNLIAKLITLGMGLLLSATSHANNWLVSVELGKSEANTGSLTAQLPSGEVTHLSDSDISWSLGIGYQLDNGLTLEASYLELGEGDVTLTGDSLSPTQYHNSVANISPVLGDGFTLGARYQLWQQEDISTSVSLGLIAWEGNITSTYQAQQITTRRDDHDIYYGLEGHYQLTKQWQLSLGFTRYALEPNDVDVIYLGGAYSF
ncbi:MULTISPECIES: TonB-dependent receptor domain-containing protein [unclassified Colwellia]|uniref:TonB-dependent receptor domain-containing protein n=1 Tax=unclassified Colwellia TaxID=196834 RepID=UPI0015F5D96B|nr:MULTISPECIES: TonB-dependent receptor [unclassified Colwellia]MBA6231807.1 TonB-dependent receptor [Colwellia sp. MB02u-7]MBA6235762.1 TonB-dependent receptor [Colwellia sp. MB02u-11]MBA6254994.1 TonB-dependent receptor [Colwellia sp. MB3u-28]MBA6259055.1 TonB-dependent receptor [Colwellia sp. MB3u-41]MBA6298851.1 TonB-dependent receptor [Colwellia sp. MB3u-22]